MPAYALLLRGINVGGRQRLAMADLRACLERLGHTGVATHLQSGNAVVTSPLTDPAAVERQVAAALLRDLGLTVRCLVRSHQELQAVIDANPLQGRATDGSKLLALFLSASPDRALLAAHDPTEAAPDDIRLGDRVIYQWCPDGVLAAPPVGPFVERHLNLAVTARNWNTVTRLNALFDD